MALQTADEYMQEISALAELQKPSSLIVRFSIEAQEDEAASAKAGRPIFNDVEVLEVRVPGDIDVLRRNATENDRREYAKQYLAFQKSQSQETVSGTPLSVWAPMKRSQVEEARHFGIFTVQQLAQVPDNHMQRLGPGWITLRQTARDWEKAANDGAAVVSLRQELENATARIKTMEEMLKKQALELHRDPKDVLAPVPAPQDDKIARLEAMLMQVIAQKAPTMPEKAPAAVQEAAKPPPPPNGATKIDGRSKAARAAKAAASRQ